MNGGAVTELRRGIVGPCVLALLERGPRYGLQLGRELEAAGDLLTSQGTLYPLLGRLSDGGLVASRWEIGESERPRRYYELTAAGHRELTRFRGEWAAFSAAVDGVLGGSRPIGDIS